MSRVPRSRTDQSRKHSTKFLKERKKVCYRLLLAGFVVQNEKGAHKKPIDALSTSLWFSLLLSTFWLIGRRSSGRRRRLPFFSSDLECRLLIWYNQIFFLFSWSCTHARTTTCCIPAAGPKFGDATPSRVAVKRDDAASLHCRVSGDAPIHLAWRRSSTSTAILSSNHRFVSNLSRRTKTPSFQVFVFNYSSSSSIVDRPFVWSQSLLLLMASRMKIQDKEANNGGTVVSTLTLHSSQVEDVIISS